MAKYWWVLKLGIHDTIFGVNVCVNFCNKSFFCFFVNRDRLTENKASKTGKLMKNTALIYWVFEFMPHLPQPWGLRRTSGGHKREFYFTGLCSTGLVGAWELMRREQLCWVHNPQESWGSFLIGERGWRLPGSTLGQERERIPALV